MVRDSIKDALARAAVSLGVEMSSEQVPLEHTDDFSHGDYASGIALAFAKQAGMPPRALAEKFVATMGEIDAVAEIEIAGPGFINFHLASDTLARTIEEANKTDMWGANAEEAGKIIMMEYTDPNPFKEFHIGHLVPNAIGESISRLFQFSGAHVLRANYQGDVGLHVAKALFILMEKGISDPTLADLSAAYPEGSTRYDNDAEAKQKIDELNKTIYEKSDAAVNALYEKGRTISLEHFEEIYKILGTKFDHYFFESATGPVGVEIVRAHPDIFVESEGATIFRGEDHGLHTRVFLTKAGLPTYEAKELGLAKLKEDAADFDRTITITANEQKDYFDVAMKAAELALPELSGKLTFRTHGLLRFAEGKMSSRTGNIIRGEDLIADLAEAAKERASESRAENADVLAQQIAVAAIKYQILRQLSHKDIIFDRDRALSLDGDSGPYLQYAHARSHAVVAKAQAEGVEIAVAHNAEPEPLARLLHRFPEIVAYATEELEPHLLTTYLLQLAGEFNSWYARVPIVDGTEAAPHKVALADAVRRTLKNGLWLLGIPAPEKM
ncbi:MAG TPA: arginine--tRNA ligase [Candidatus Paceibacterota bacterium]|nr:arginine--tRNA ligase [Candidatus Paceibacterota bacterium]